MGKKQRRVKINPMYQTFSETQMQTCFERKKDAGCLICFKDKLRTESEAKTLFENAVFIPPKRKKDLLS